MTDAVMRCRTSVNTVCIRYITVIIFYIITDLDLRLTGGSIPSLHTIAVEFFDTINADATILTWISLSKINPDNKAVIGVDCTVVTHKTVAASARVIRNAISAFSILTRI
jgi:hypothetical protein